MEVLMRCRNHSELQQLPTRPLSSNGPGPRYAFGNGPPQRSSRTNDGDRPRIPLDDDFHAGLNTFLGGRRLSRSASASISWITASCGCNRNAASRNVHSIQRFAISAATPCHLPFQFAGRE
jgi:hypothetical protein